MPGPNYKTNFMKKFIRIAVIVVVSLGILGVSWYVQKNANLTTISK